MDAVDRQRLFDDNVKLAYYHAKRYYRAKRARWVPYDDLCQVALLEMWRATNDYDLGRGTAFGPFATRYICNGLLIFVLEARLIRVPTYLFMRSKDPAINDRKVRMRRCITRSCAMVMPEDHGIMDKAVYDHPMVDDLDESEWFRARLRNILTPDQLDVMLGYLRGENLQQQADRRGSSRQAVDGAIRNARVRIRRSFGGLGPYCARQRRIRAVPAPFRDEPVPASGTTVA